MPLVEYSPTNVSPFTIFMICLQACLIQAVFSSCGCGSNKLPTATYGCGKAATSAGLFSSGSGDVGVWGELPVAGTTAVQGIVPAIGGVYFDGLVPASGAVTISGACAYPKPAPRRVCAPAPKTCGCN